MEVSGIGGNAVYTNSYGTTKSAIGRTYKNTRDYKSYLTGKYACLRSKDYSVNINPSFLAEAMGDEKKAKWLEYNLELIPKTVEQTRKQVEASGAKIISQSITINGYDSMTEETCTQDVVDLGTEKAKKELEEKIKKIREEKKETEERLEKQRTEKKEQKDVKQTVKADGKDVEDLTGKIIDILSTSTSAGQAKDGMASFDVI